jgi:hypothetical protein
MLDAVSSALLDTRNVSGFSSGRYLVWNISGHVKLRITSTGGANARRQRIILPIDLYCIRQFDSNPELS